MNLLIVVVFVLPAVPAFVVLWHLDSALISRVDNPFIRDLIEVFVALLVVALERLLFYIFCFANDNKKWRTVLCSPFSYSSFTY